MGFGHRKLPARLLIGILLAVTLIAALALSLLQLRQPSSMQRIYSPGNGSGIVSSLIEGPDGCIYASTLDADLLAFNPDTTLRWNFKAVTPSQRIQPLAALADGRVLVWDCMAEILVLSSTGSLLRSFQVPSRRTPIVSPEGKVYALGPDAVVRIYDTDGQLSESFPTATYTGGYSPTFLELGPQGTVACVNLNEGARMFDSNGAQLYSVGWLSAHDVAMQLAGDGTLYVNCSSICKCGLRAYGMDGSVRWQVQAPRSIGMPQLGADGNIYLLTGNYSLNVYSPDGKQLWTYQHNGPVVYPLSGGKTAVAADSTVWYACRNETSASKGLHDLKSKLGRAQPALRKQLTVDARRRLDRLMAVKPGGKATREYRVPAGCGNDIIAAQDGKVYFSTEAGELWVILPEK